MAENRRVRFRRRFRIWSALAIAGACLAGPTPAWSEVRFNRDIRPILSEHCLRCHGEDREARQAELRLDQRDSAVAERDGGRAIAAGQPDASELMRRVTSNDASLQMPPPDSPQRLSPKEISLLRQWIEQGAAYESHWSLIPPLRPLRPAGTSAPWSRNEIDGFVLERLEREGLAPSPEADRAALIRRLTLDLTGLPPTLSEVDAFLADASPQAYESVVDRLLASPRYGEHQARHWLDAARYADTNGYFTDDERTMWPWRDWVIRAFNSGMPFDRFTIEQLAGDLLPAATLEQKIATGFNRNHMTTHETGVIDEEYRVEYVADRLQTTATIWLGLTVGCARCHDHKYDPISQREFYQLFAFFNGGPEKGNTGGPGNSAPILHVPAPQLDAEILSVRRDSDAAQRELLEIEPQLAAAQQEWERTAVSALAEPPTSGRTLHLDMEPASGGAARRFAEAGSVEWAPSLIGTGAQFNGDAALELSDSPHFERTAPFSFAAWVKPSNSPACVLSKNDDVDSMRGVDLILRKGQAIVHLIHRWNGNAIQVAARTPIRSGSWQHIGVSYDGSSRAEGVRIYFDGVAQPVDRLQDSLTGTIQTSQPLRIGRRSSSAALVGLIDEVCIYSRELTADEMLRLATVPLVRGIVAVAPEQRTAAQREQLRELFLTLPAGEKFRPVVARAQALQKRRRAIESQAPTAMVMEDLSAPRDTFLLIRGEYDRPGEKVAAKAPTCLPPLPAGAAANRLGLARWLVAPSQPLTARVTVNRLWQQHFGTGIVKTVEDFGSQGAWPSHPELLDWLAVELVESGWDVKRLQRSIVTSSTYRQSSRLTRELQARDPDNRLLARAPRLRLDAESIRDNALAVAGLLDRQIGGPSVKPYQPAGLWEAVSYDGGLSYAPDHGAALYRRSLYTFWKRQSPPPAMLAFDAPTRETCAVQRPRTNTPLQALALLNDPTFVEAARRMARRVLTECDGSAADRMRYALRLATARIGEEDEVATLLEVLQSQRNHYQRNLVAAEGLLEVGESPRLAKLEVAEHAAWTIVASMILNLDETVTRQ